jgi:hypothetical protein
MLQHPSGTTRTPIPLKPPDLRTDHLDHHRHPGHVPRDPGRRDLRRRNPADCPDAPRPEHRDHRPESVVPADRTTDLALEDGHGISRLGCIETGLPTAAPLGRGTGNEGRESGPAAPGCDGLAACANPGRVEPDRCKAFSLETLREQALPGGDATGYCCVRPSAWDRPAITASLPCLVSAGAPCGADASGFRGHLPGGGHGDCPVEKHGGAPASRGLAMPPCSDAAWGRISCLPP